MPRQYLSTPFTRIPIASADEWSGSSFARDVGQNIDMSCVRQVVHTREFTRVPGRLCDLMGELDVRPLTFLSWYIAALYPRRSARTRHPRGLIVLRRSALSPSLSLSPFFFLSFSFLAAASDED